MNHKSLLQALLSGLVLNLYGCGNWLDSMLAPQLSLTQEELEEFVQLKVPNNAVILDFYALHWQDSTVWLKLNVPCEEREDLFISNADHVEERSTTKSYLVNLPAPEFLSWWNPSEIESFESIRVTEPDELRWGRNVLSEQGTTGMCLMYVSAYDM